MLGRVQSSSPSSENHTTTVYDEEISVLERQRAIFERLYESQQHISCLPHQQNASQFNNLISEKNYPIKIDENSPFLNMFDREQRNWGGSDFNNNNNNNNSVELACQSSFSTVSHSSVTRSSTKKRKTEFLDEDNCKAKRHEGETGEVKSEITVKSEKGNLKDNSSEVKKTDYIHVRARRGQATDSHSLAERARREKISKKMKCLQDLVPGCNQVIGKAGMLDEIINYVQSLQKQVEFLSMKLATSNLNTSDHLFSTYMANFQNLANIQPCLQNNLLLQQQQESSVGRENCLISSFPEAFLDSSRLPVGQQLQSFETDLQSLFGIRFQ